MEGAGGSFARDIELVTGGDRDRFCQSSDGADPRTRPVRRKGPLRPHFEPRCAEGVEGGDVDASAGRYGLQIVAKDALREDPLRGEGCARAGDASDPGGVPAVASGDVGYPYDETPGDSGAGGSPASRSELSGLAGRPVAEAG